MPIFEGTNVTIYDSADARVYSGPVERATAHGFWFTDEEDEESEVPPEPPAPATYEELQAEVARQRGEITDLRVQMDRGRDRLLEVRHERDEARNTVSAQAAQVATALTEIGRLIDARSGSSPEDRACRTGLRLARALVEDI